MISFRSDRTDKIHFEVMWYNEMHKEMLKFQRKTQTTSY